MKKKGLQIIMICIVLIIMSIGVNKAKASNLQLSEITGTISMIEKVELPIKVACVGDSITYGYGLNNWEEENYPAVLSGLMGDGYQVENFGVSGRTVQSNGNYPYTATDAYKASIEFQSSILVFMMGSNDAKTINWKGTEAFEKELNSILDSYIQAKEIYLCTPASVFYSEKQLKTLKEYNIQPGNITEITEIVKRVADERGYCLIDINALTASYPEWFEVDGVHPNAEGAAAIAKEIEKNIKQDEE